MAKEAKLKSFTKRTKLREQYVCGSTNCVWDTSVGELLLLNQRGKSINWQLLRFFEGKKQFQSKQKGDCQRSTQQLIDERLTKRSSSVDYCPEIDPSDRPYRIIINRRLAEICKEIQVRGNNK